MNDYEIARPNAASLIQSLRAFGYSISMAIADLIDNSITAKADEISIQFEWNNGKPWIAISDNGIGMDECELTEAMKPGSKSPLDNRSENDLGRFGLGLKTASFSQCKRLTVITKRDNQNCATKTWDLDFVTQKNDWLLMNKGSSTADELKEVFFKDRKHGTIVLWEKVDRLVEDTKSGNEKYQEAFLDYASEVKNHISLVFSEYMLGRKKPIKFSLNGNEVKAWDPFLRGKSTQLPKETLFVDGQEISVEPFILPHHNKLSLEEYKIAGGKRGWNDLQGFYIYRNKRLIVAADWLTAGIEKKEQYKLARIRVDIGNNTDEQWNLDVKKAVAIPPVQIRDEIKRIAKIATKQSSQVFRHRGKSIARSAHKDKTFVWQQSIRHGKIGYKINRNHPIIKSALQQGNNEIKELLNIIEETIPVPMIISDYSDRSEKMLKPFEQMDDIGANLDKLMTSLYDMYIENGLSSEKAIETIANIEPFTHTPERVALFCEKRGIIYATI